MDQLLKPVVHYPFDCSLPHFKNVLEKGFMQTSTFNKTKYFLCGNGPFILTGICSSDPKILCSRPLNMKETKVFPLVPVNIREIIVLTQEKLIAAFGGLFIAFLDFDQVIEGGTLCASRMVSTKRVVVGGRYVGEGTMQLFFENGSFENWTISLKDTIGIKRSGAKKLALRGAKITCLRDFNSSILIGTSFGQIISPQGKVFLPSSRSNGAVRQLTPISSHLIAVLFQNLSIALFNITLKSITSVLEGRFTAIESDYMGDVLIAGDLDGSLHSFSISSSSSLELISVSQFIDKGHIVKLTPMDKNTLALANDMGALNIIARARFRKEEVKVDRINPTFLKFGSHRLSANGTEFYTIHQKAIYIKGPLETDNWKHVHAGPFHKLKSFLSSEFKAVYAYGKEIVIVFCSVGQGRFERILPIRNATAVVVTNWHLLVQSGENISVYFLLPQLKEPFIIVNLNVQEDSEITDFFVYPQIETGTLMVTFSRKNGNVYYFHCNLGGGKQEIDIVCFEQFPNDYVVSIHAQPGNLCLLTSKGQLLRIILASSTNVSLPVNAFLEGPSRSYRSLIGRGYKIVGMMPFFLIIGFKQNRLCAYNLDHQMAFSVETDGPRSPFSFFFTENDTCTVCYSLKGRFVVRKFNKLLRLKEIDFGHTTPVVCAKTMGKFVMVDGVNMVNILTGDSHGKLCLILYRNGAEGNVLRTAVEYHLSGAIREIGRCAEVIWVGTSAGQLFLLEDGYTYLFPTAILNFEAGIVSVTYLCTEPFFGTVHLAVCITTGQILIVSYNKTKNPRTKIVQPNDFVEENAKTVVNVRSHLDFEPIVLDQEGFLYRYTVLGKRNVIEQKSTDRYSYINKFGLSIKPQTTEKQQIIAGFYDGYFIHYVFDDQKKKIHFFLIDKLHSHEIIDFAQYSDTGTQHLVTLDKSGVIVVRELAVFRNSMRIVGFPTIYHSSVPKPSRVLFLFNTTQIMVVGKGIALIDLK